MGQLLRLTALLLVLVSSAAAQRYSMRWAEIPIALIGRTAVVFLDDGSRAEGRWLSVTPDSFTLLVKRSSGTIKRGHQTIERARFRSLAIRRDQTWRRRAGSIGGFIGGIYIAAYGIQSGAAVYYVAWPAGVIGFLVGRHLDRKSEPVTILPD
ncbi:MAG TPA: hypothetical protein VEQ63_12455 [Bryobacteraceae bacterium]|nr:hypothetical protein [Bryobacteraceae bacterium]